LRNDSRGTSRSIISSKAWKKTGRGAGKFLIGEMIRRARDQLKAEEVCLVCHNVNTNALPLYHTLGFKPFDMKPVKDWDGRDMAGIMMKRSAI
jgi:GNAT superfamily N-acetyltransferase